MNAEGLVMGEGGQVNGVQLGRLSTIVKPVAVPTSAPASHTPITYEVQGGESLKTIAARFNVSIEDIRWSNFAALRSATKDVAQGQKILIPPVDGVVVITQQGDTPLSLSQLYHVTPGVIVDFNYLRTFDQDPLTPGTSLVIPGGRGQAFDRARPAAPAAPASASTSPTYNGAAGNRFPYGYCTWYVYNRRPVPWLGNAWQWYGQAQAYGWATGQTPRPGAIMVTWESSFGHVAYVESVNSDGSWTVSEMNYKAWGVVDQRTIRPGQVPLIGFIL